MHTMLHEPSAWHTRQTQISYLEATLRHAVPGDVVPQIIPLNPYDLLVVWYGPSLDYP